MKKQLLFFFLLLFSLSLFAQGSDVVVPVSWSQDLSSGVSPIELPPLDLTQIEAEDAINDLDKSLPYRYGVERNLSVAIKKEGVLTQLENGDKIWQIAIVSPQAVNMSVNFNKFHLPEGARLHIFNGDKTDLSKPYTQFDNRANNILGSWFVQGQEIWLEYFEPAQINEPFKLEIGSIIHGYRMGAVEEYIDVVTRGLNDSGACNYDVNCPVGEDFDSLKDIVKKAVALLNLGNGYLCSAVLLNNVENDKKPYLLTANHCLEGSNPALWSARFNWMSPSPVCGTGEDTAEVANNFTLSGVEVRASNAQTDFALVELSNAIPDSWDITFAGWDATDEAPGFEVGIHHPNGDIMKICRDDSGAVKESANGVDVWLIGGVSIGTGNGWELGTTESGSSGSPLFNQNGKVIGQLYAGQAFCNGTESNNDYDVYGRFGVSWDAGNSSDKRLMDWLDPLGTGTMSTETLTNLLNVPDNQFIGDLKIYPNPASSVITIMNNKYPNLHYQMYDVLGKMIALGQLHNTANSIMVEHLTEGVYFLHLEDPDSGDSITKKIVVRHQ
jgi:lysyl endopeptidase